MMKHRFRSCVLSPKTDSLATTGEQPVDKPASERQPRPRHTTWDQVGMIGSAICVIHCLATPLVVGLLSAVGLGFIGGELLHKVLVVPLLGVALLAFWPGYRHHGNKKILSSGAAGVLALLVAVFVLEPFHAHDLATATTVVGSVILIGAHGANWRVTSHHDPCCSTD